MKKLLVIAAGGVAGSLLRYALMNRSDELNIFLINLLGVLVAGLFAYRFRVTELSQLFWIPGFAGSLTTFSSVALIHSQRSDFVAILYFYFMVLASVFILFLLAPKSKANP